VNRLTLGIVTAGLLVASALLWSRETPPVLVGVSVPGLLGFLVALALGFKLLRMIRKDGQETQKL
jgi:ubiquinone biosynthesis protein